MEWPTRFLIFASVCCGKVTESIRRLPMTRPTCVCEHCIVAFVLSNAWRYFTLDVPAVIALDAWLWPELKVVRLQNQCSHILRSIIFLVLVLPQDQAQLTSPHQHCQHQISRKVIPQTERAVARFAYGQQAQDGHAQHQSIRMPNHKLRGTQINHRFLKMIREK